MMCIASQYRFFEICATEGSSDSSSESSSTDSLEGEDVQRALSIILKVVCDEVLPRDQCSFIMLYHYFYVHCFYR